MMVGEMPLGIHVTSGATVQTIQRVEDATGNIALDVSLTSLSKLIKYNRNVIPTWIYGAEATAPGGGTVLVTKTVTAGKTGHLYGIMISAQEANDFKINWTSGSVAKSFRIIAGSMGTVIFTDVNSLFEGITADAGSAVTITNVSAAAGGKIYQAALLYAEV